MLYSSTNYLDCLKQPNQRHTVTRIITERQIIQYILHYILKSVISVVSNVFISLQPNIRHFTTSDNMQLEAGLKRLKTVFKVYF